MRKILLCMIGCALAVAIGLFLFTAEEYREARDVYEELREEVIDEEEDDYLKINFEKLKKINPDIVAWLQIPGTRISYPVLQGSEYEHLSYDGKESICGSIFLTDDENLECRNPILYGHNMRDGSMFGTLKSYKDEKYGRKHQKIRLYRESGCVEYDLFAVVKTTKDGEEYQTEFEDEREFQEYVERTRGESLYRTEIRSETLLSISTCVGNHGTVKRLFLLSNLERVLND